MAGDRRPTRAARTPRLALTGWSLGLDRRKHQSAFLPHGCALWRLSRIQSIFGGTTEIMKEIIGCGLGL